MQVKKNLVKVCEPTHYQKWNKIDENTFQNSSSHFILDRSCKSRLFENSGGLVRSFIVLDVLSSSSAYRILN